MRYPSPLVLLYHGFGSRPPADDPHNLFVPLADLDRQLRLLSRLFRPLDLDGYLAGLDSRRWPRRSVLVTIDDGYRSTLTHAAPLFARHRVPAVLFVPPARLGGSSGWMPEMPQEELLLPEEVADLRCRGIEVGVHGMDHTLLSGLTSDELVRQVSEARVALADLVGTLPRAFAYPGGVFDAATVRAVEREGYDIAFSVEAGGHGRLSVSRRAVNARDAPLTFAVKLFPGFDRFWAATARRPRLRRLGATVARQRAGGTGVRQARQPSP